MKNAASYISSFVFALLFVFSLIASAGCLTVEKFASKESLIRLTEENNISSIVYKEIEKHFTEKYADTGIPADVYMNALSEEYLQTVINHKIDYGFTALNRGDTPGSAEIPVNSALENSITSYYEEYAENTDYKIKDENDPYYAKLADAKKKANSAIEEFCDVFKFNALVKHGIIKKAKPLYVRLPMIRTICLGVSAFLALILLVCNFKRIKDSLYWIGTGAFCAGILGGIPCIYLLNTDYFSSFTIKQAQIYTSYTSAMITFTKNLLTACIILIIAAVILYILYGICSAMTAKNDSKSITKDNNSIAPPNN